MGNINGFTRVAPTPPERLYFRQDKGCMIAQFRYTAPSFRES